MFIFMMPPPLISGGFGTLGLTGLGLGGFGTFGLTGMGLGGLGTYGLTGILKPEKI